MKFEFKIKTQKQLLDEVKGQPDILNGFEGFTENEIKSITGFPFFLIAYCENGDIAGILQYHVMSNIIALSIEYIVLALIEVKEKYKKYYVGPELVKYFNDMYERQFILCEMLKPYRREAFVKAAKRILNNNKLYIDFETLFNEYEYLIELHRKSAFGDTE